MVPNGSSINFVQRSLGNLNQTKFNKKNVEYVELSRKKKTKIYEVLQFSSGFSYFKIITK